MPPSLLCFDGFKTAACIQILISRLLCTNIRNVHYKKKEHLQHLSSVLEADASQKVSNFGNAVHINLRRGEKIAECSLLSSCRNQVVYSVHF